MNKKQIYDPFEELLNSREFGLNFYVQNNLLTMDIVDSKADSKIITAKSDVWEFNKNAYSIWIKPHNYMQQQCLVSWSSQIEDRMFRDEVFAMNEKSEWIVNSGKDYWNLERDVRIGESSKDSIDFLGGDMIVYTQKEFRSVDIFFGSLKDNAEIHCGRELSVGRYVDYVQFNLRGMRFVSPLLEYLNKFKLCNGNEN